MTAVATQTRRPPVPKSKDFQIRRMIVTPEQATVWLERNVNNRKLTNPMDDAQVAAYARDMKAGRWHLTGDPISFDTEGDLLNGQHRLWACIIADTAFETSVATGVDPAARIVIDTGKKRTLGMYFQMKGEPHANALAAAANLCIRWELGQIAGDGGGLGLKRNVTHEDAVEWLAENQDIRQSVLFGGKVYREIKLGQPQIAVAHYLNARVDCEAADDFWEHVATGAGLSVGSPVLALRRWTQNQRASRQKVPGDLILVHYLKAMRVWRDGRTVRILSVKSGENITAWES